MKKFSKSIAAISVVILICFTAQIFAANSLSGGNGAVRTVPYRGRRGNYYFVGNPGFCVPAEKRKKPRGKFSSKGQ